MPAPDANGCSVGSMRQVSGRWPNRSTTSWSRATCAIDGKVAREKRVVDVAIAELRDQRHELLADLGEDARHLGRPHLRLEVVEQDVVRLVARLEARDVLQAQLDVALEHRQEELEVGRRLRLEPGSATDSAERARHLLAQRGGNADCLVVVAACDADRRRVDRVGIERRLHRRELVEQATDLGIDQALVRESLQERGMICAMRAAGGRHHRALVPVEQPREGIERLDVGEPGLELFEGVSHAGRLEV